MSSILRSEVKSCSATTTANFTANNKTTIIIIKGNTHTEQVPPGFRTKGKTGLYLAMKGLSYSFVVFIMRPVFFNLILCLFLLTLDT